MIIAEVSGFEWYNYQKNNSQCVILAPPKTPQPHNTRSKCKKFESAIAIWKVPRKFYNTLSPIFFNCGLLLLAVNLSKSTYRWRLGTVIDMLSSGPELFFWSVEQRDGLGELARIKIRESHVETAESLERKCFGSNFFCLFWIVQFHIG